MENGGLMHGFQIWVNLPAKDKMMEPRYQDIPSEDIPEVSNEDGTVWAKVIAGEALGVSAVIDTVIPITCIHPARERSIVFTCLRAGPQRYALRLWWFTYGGRTLAS